jgi:hypothetical protein
VELYGKFTEDVPLQIGEIVPNEIVGGLDTEEQGAGAVTGKSTISQAPVVSSVIVIVKFPLEIRLPENVVADP